MLRLRVALRDYFPAALEAYKPLGLTSEAVLRLLVKAPTPATAAKLTISQIGAALKGRRDIQAKAEAIQNGLRSEQLGQADLVTNACASTVRALAAVITTLNAEIKTLEGEVEAHFGQHPDAEVILSQREGTHELRRNLPDHPPIRQEAHRSRPVRAQRPARRRPSPPSFLRRPARPRGPRLLRRAPRP
ncbi:hypothetical protein AB0H88_41355 [Nonomuraea sp. NPDC050680]|uniref:hypothetical protein n=1 Tax=Nonomuraea sp. NPDC050680 TaxID=3154630 RepID=UPI0033D6C0AC